MALHPTELPTVPGRDLPDPLVDIKRAIAWVHHHAREHGGNPQQIFITGGSAGAHLSTLAALTMNDPSFQPGFEDADTSVVAAITLYGDYDWLDSHGERAETWPRSVEVLRRQDREMLGGHRPQELGAGSPTLPRPARCTAVLHRARFAGLDAAGRGRTSLRRGAGSRCLDPRSRTPNFPAHSTRSTVSSRCDADP